MARTKTIPLFERTFIRAGTLEDASVNPIIAPTTLKRLLDGEPGIVLFDSQHRPVATVPMSVSEMAGLKGTGGVDKVLGGLERANAFAAMVYVPETDAKSMAAARNTGTLIDKAGTRMLDLIVGTTSQEATGRPLKKSSSVVESRHPLLPRQPGGVSVSTA